MNKYFEKIINILGIIIAITTSLLENTSYEIKLIVFISILFIAILISYIYSTIKYQALLKQNEQLIEENATLKEQLSQNSEILSLRQAQLESYTNDDHRNELPII